MSVFSGLFGGPKDGIDTDKNVADLFKKSVGPVPKDALRSARTVIKIRETKTESAPEEASSQETSSEEAEEEEEEDDEEEEQNFKKSKKQRKANALNEDLEAKYFDKLLKSDNNDKKSEETKEVESGAESDSDSDSDSESDNEKSNEKKSKAARMIDLKETELEKSERTIFVGNVVSTVITSKQVYKKFKQLFSQFGKIDSIRFRSISFEEALPRKIAFTQKKLHNSRDTFNAYIVFKEKDSSVKAAAKMNATLFENFHIRVDHVGHPAPKDNRRSIFVGNLDFEEKEEALWRYFNSKTDNDVESVRVIRDSKTNLGKGFAIVQFKDTLSVNKALLLNDKPISKEKTRKLRISRAKSHTKPSILSPNHFENLKKNYASNKSKLANLTDQQRTKLGRAQRVLGKADRSTVGKSKKLVIEGQRAVKGSLVAGIKGLKGKKDKKPRVKKPRIRDRSTKFKEERAAMQKE